MTSQQRIAAFKALGKYLEDSTQSFDKVVNDASRQNRWFDRNAIHQSIKHIAGQLLHSDYRGWLEPYGATIEPETKQQVGLVLAGNIPMVGFHDLLCCLISGFSVQLKTSSDDDVLMKFLIRELTRIQPLFSDKIKFVPRLQHFDLVIATGSNNTSRYFEHYFGKVPHIIRKNRNSVGIVTTHDDEKSLLALGHDIFTYFGLGCRNVSKLFFPEQYPMDHFFKAIESFKTVADNSKYFNNYEYNKALFLVNGSKHFDNGFLLLSESEKIASPLAVCYFGYYRNISEVEDNLNRHADEIQCVSTNNQIMGISTQQVRFGQAQKPEISDYADNVDTIAFLLKHKQTAV